jgi:hypothetical protein
MQRSSMTANALIAAVTLASFSSSTVLALKLVYFSRWYARPDSYLSKMILGQRFMTMPGIANGISVVPKANFILE